MANQKMAIPLVLALAFGAPAMAVAQVNTPESTPENTADANPDTETTQQPESEPTDRTMTRGEVAIKSPGDMRIADLPAGHWATNATQVAVANHILALKNGEFDGSDPLTERELVAALEAMTNTAEAIAGKGALPGMHAALGALPRTDAPVNRMLLARALSAFVGAANREGLVALGSPTSTAKGFKDLGGQVPPSVAMAVDRYKVMTGFPDNTFRPNDRVNRYQMAAVALHILNSMREAPIAQQPAAPQAPTIVVVPPRPQPEPEKPAPVEIAPVKMERLSFRERTPINLSWQALNASNLSGQTNPFNVIPLQGMFTTYSGPVMLQNVTNFRYDLYQSNLLDSEFRIGYGEWKAGIFQLIPYVGGNVGIGAAIPKNTTQYDTYVGATYGGILSMMPMDNFELWGSFGQSQLLAGGRYNANFQPAAYPTALGAVLSNYGFGADFYVAPNIALSLGLNTWQQPAQLRSTMDLSTGGVINTYGGNLGMGFSF